MIYVYSQANCSGCVLLKNQLKQSGIEFEEMRVDLDTEALAFMKHQSHRSVPQVYDVIRAEFHYIGTKFSDVQTYINKGE